MKRLLLIVTGRPADRGEVFHKVVVVKSDTLYYSLHFLTYKMLDILKSLLTNNQLYCNKLSNKWYRMNALVLVLYRQQSLFLCFRNLLGSVSVDDHDLDPHGTWIYFY